MVGGLVLAPKDIRGGAESGTSEKLAHFILQDLPPSNEPRQLLYLTGDKNRDVLPSILSSQAWILKPGRPCLDLKG